MLRNCFIPVNYNQKTSQTCCGEIIYQNIDEFIITCSLCKIKMFEFDEFISHLKNVHLEELVNFAALSVNAKEEGKSKGNLEEILEDEEDVNFHQILKSRDSYANNKSDCKDTQDIQYLTIDPQVATSDYEQLSNADEEYVFSDEEYVPDDDEDLEAKSIMKKSRKPKEYSCAMCGKKYAEERRLQMHIKILHLREKKFKCTYCPESFVEERSLKNHIGNKHTGYDCPTCQKNFSSGRNLKRHMQIHIETKAFICPENNCGKAYASNNLLRDHQRCHRNEILICEECGYKCRKRDSLIVHKRHHTGEKPFACKQCDSRFASKPLLKEHMATHEIERKHICDVCGKSFNRPKALYHHKHLHLGIKKFVCKTCGSAYAQAAGLSAHMRRHREEISGITKDVALTKNQPNIFGAYYDL